MDQWPTTLAFVVRTAPCAIQHVRIGGDASQPFFECPGMRPMNTALAVADDANARMAG